MKFTLEIICDNAAFEGDNLYPELARILRSKASELDNRCPLIAVRDINGNRVGDCYLDGDDSD